MIEREKVLINPDIIDNHIKINWELQKLEGLVKEEHGLLLIKIMENLVIKPAQMREH